ncbi:MAG: hypothetical protein AAFQ33_10045 [Pseudomonadota bacterium]
MTRLTAAFLAAAALALPAAGGEERILSPDEFEDFTEGYTMRFIQDGRFVGAEMFLPGRRVTWQYSNGACTGGGWYAEEGAICFVYIDSPDPQCWHFLERDGRYFARLRGSEDPVADYELTSRDRAPLQCGDPGLDT